MIIIMKITKTRLKQIIKEELEAVVTENREEFVKYAPDGTRLGTDDIGAHISDSLRKWFKNPRRVPIEDHIDILVKQLVNFFGDEPDDARDRVNAEFKKLEKKRRDREKGLRNNSAAWKAVYGEPPF